MSYKQKFVSPMNSLIERIISYRMLSIHLDRLSVITLTLPSNGFTKQAGRTAI